MKLSASTPRVTRSPIPERGQVVVMNGDQFEDGRQRIVVGYDVTPEDAQELGRILDARDAAQERLTAYVEKINALMAGATRPTEPDPDLPVPCSEECDWCGENMPSAEPSDPSSGGTDG